jgi:hypothetical protein
MREVVYGEDITFTLDIPEWADYFYDDATIVYNEDLYYGAPLVVASILRNGLLTTYGPYTLEDGDISINGSGEYVLVFSVPYSATPGFYTVRWTVTLDDRVEYFLEDFSIIDPPVIPNETLDAPQLYGIMRESILYQTMGMGATDQVLLLGHAQGLPINDPFQVRNMKEAINLMGADSNSPLLRGLLEAYNGGSRDIWLMCVAPITEYVDYVPDSGSRFEARDEWGGLNFYQRYHQRLDTAYTLLREYDYPNIIVPIEAPFYDAGDVDFAEQLLDHCYDSYVLTGKPRLGIIGTRFGGFSAEVVDTLLADERLEQYANATDGRGKFIMVAVGEASFMLPQMPLVYNGSVGAHLAGILSASPLNRGLTYRTLPNAVNPVGRDLKEAEIRALSRVRLNPLIRRARGKRGTPYQCCLATDNTLAPDGSDYWALGQIRLVSQCIARIRAFGNKRIGTIGFAQFDQEVRQYLESLTRTRLVNGYQAAIYRDSEDKTKAHVEVVLKPYIGLREIFFQIEVGPGHGLG